jgi:hypothetical protein
MFQVFQYVGKVQRLRGRMLGLPAWCRAIIFIAALPGALLLSLSILAVLVSILALLLLTVPLYRVFQALFGQAPVEQTQVPASPNLADLFGAMGGGMNAPVGDNDAPDMVSPGRKKVDVTIIE